MILKLCRSDSCLGWGLSESASPFCVKLHYALRYKRLPFETVNLASPSQLKKYNLNKDLFEVACRTTSNDLLPSAYSRYCALARRSTCCGSPASRLCAIPRACL